ncbi:TonB-dependent receptor plug domain-containing protein [Emcibacter sp.]|uniref:TonB-dependent receptor plug domain-containing protein n=1 Tax=Emcibacter sp. TaxID=1979954 RepID=UPI003A94C15F
MKKFLMAATALAPLGLAAAAHGQTVNYNDLQDLFGEPVTTSATGKPQRQSEAPASMIIVTGEELRRSGARTIPDILQNYAGMDVNRYSTSQREVTVRGANLPLSPRLLVLVNGRQTYLDHYGYTDWNLVGVEIGEIQQVEVVKGPNSALFGFNAVAGVVNIITIDALTRGNSISAKAEGGTDDTYGVSLVGTFKASDRLGFKVSGGLEETEEWDSITAADGKPKRQNFSAEVTSQLADNIRGTFSYTYSDAVQIDQAYSYAMHKVDSTLHGLNGVVAADTSAGLIKAQVFFNKLDQDVPTISDIFGIKNDILSVKLEDLFKAGSDHSFRVGVEYRRNEYEIKQNASGKTFYDVFAGSAMWEWKISERLTLTNAVRVDRLNLGHGEINEPLYPRTVADYDKSYTELSYNSSMSFAINDQSRIRVGAARGIQAPSLNALGVSVIAPGIVVAGNPNLEPGVTESYEIAFDHSIAKINGAFNLTVSTSKTTGFMAASQHAIVDSVTEGGLLVLTDEQVGDFKTWAVEASVNGRTMNNAIGWAVNYTATGVTEEFLTDALETGITMDEGTPTHKINAKLDYSKDGWGAYVVGRYRSATVQRMPAAGTYAELDEAITIDGKLSYTFENGVSVWAVGENLTANDAAGLSVFEAERRFLGGIGFKY